MSEREGGASFGAFLVGLAVGAAVGFLFAPEAGTSTRRKVSRKFEDLKVAAAREDRAAVSTAKKELQRRVLEARRRRHAVRAARREGTTVAAEGEEDEPVA